MRKAVSSVQLVSALALLAAGGLSLSSCILGGNACDDAKAHLCAKLPEMGCSTMYMDNAVASLRQSCGTSEAQRYIGYAEGACRSKTLVCGQEGPRLDSGTPPGGCGPYGKVVEYAGTAEADGRSARLKLTFTNARVDGELTADPVCSGSVRLTRTQLSFTAATLTGSWESPTGMITGLWQGGDYDCDGKLMSGYPTSGSVTITISGGMVYLQRVAGAGKYAFPAKNVLYAPVPCKDAGVPVGGCTIGSVSPATADQYETVTISGSGFGSTAGSVSFGGIAAQPINAWSDTSISVAVPATVSYGPVVLSVTTSAGKTCSRANYVIESKGCVAAGTRVRLASGETKPIEELGRHEELFAGDGTRSGVRTAVIQKTLVHREQSYSLHRIRLSKRRSLLVTGNHPVLTRRRGWVPVDELRAGDWIYVLGARSRRLTETRILSIVRDESQTDVVYNLKTSAGSYFANDILVHNKCLAAGSPIDTPRGPVPIERLAVGQLVYGDRDGQRVVTRVTHLYAKATVLPRLPGKRLTPRVTATLNHWVREGAAFVRVRETAHPLRSVTGTVYDLETEAGNYYADGLLMRASE